MLTDKQKRIVSLLLTNKEGYNVNQIARILDISVSWTHETLKALEKEGILTSAKAANSILFKINWSNPKAEKVCEFILIDESLKKENKEVKEQKVEQKEKQVYANFYNPQETGPRGSYSPVLNTPGITGSPYKQTSTESFSSSGYSVAPIGEQGVNTVLSSYAASGAFNNSVSYSSGSSYSSNQVPPGSLGSKISSNVSGFTMSQHTTQHSKSAPGCRYCGPEIKL